MMAGNSKGATDVEKICEHLFDEVKRVYAEDKKLSYDLLSVLQFMFQSPLLSALDLVEKEAVTKVVSQSKRELFQIVGSSGTPYICFPDSKYCSCPAYLYSVLMQDEFVMCKHVLAMRLAVSMGTCKHLDVSDEEINSMIKNMD